MNEHDERAKTAADPERGAADADADADAVEAVTEDPAAHAGERTRQEPEVVERTLFDGSVTPMQLYRPKGEPKAIVVFFPGFGMGARYYWPMAQELCDRGYGVLVSELHGQGEQTAKPTRRNQWGYNELASNDFPEAVATARAEFETSGERLPVYLMCHSMGGQIGSLYLSRPEADVDGMITVGSGTPHHIRFTGDERRRLRWGGPVMWSVSRLLGYWPAGPLDLAGYGRQSGRHVREWAMFARDGRLRPATADMDYAREMPKVTTPVLMLTCDGDRDCTPESAMDLASRLPKAARFEFLDHRLGHNRWAREPEAVADRFERWLDELASGQPWP
ncbi:alpha/beta fold hydrolase [Corynebacterium freneyi]|uniref:alpha/beta fold hydrolase n=1 Tax=Corynebacterium freneyi TaxID=134034 RepID=UPI001EF33405|nr:alpha/beta fold hydrolase [Corynebacterium freneyi]